VTCARVPTEQLEEDNAGGDTNICQRVREEENMGGGTNICQRVGRALRRWGRAAAQLARRAAHSTRAVMWRQRDDGDTRRRIMDTLGRAAMGGTAADAVAMEVVGRGAAATAQRMRGVRRYSTVCASAGTMRQVVAFMESNPTMANGSRAVTNDVWDVVLETFLIAKVNPPGHEWVRPGRWSACRAAVAGKEVGAVVAALERMGHVEGASWSRLKAQRGALGCGDTTRPRKEPIFVWEFAARARGGRPVGAWERCAWALVTVSSIGAGRIGVVSTMEMRHIKTTTLDSVVVVDVDAAHKGDRERVVRRGAHRPVALEHWMVARFLTPWVREMRAAGAGDTAYLFPSMVDMRYARIKSAVGRVMDGLWLEPVRAWSPLAIERALDLTLEARNGRTMHCCRGGNNRELRKVEDVSDVTRRTIHGRSVKDLIGSEDAYADVFIEDFRAATRSLGSKRIERMLGMYSMVATSASAGELEDYIPTASPIAIEEEPDEDESTGEDVPAGARGYRCGGCRRTVRARDHGFGCDIEGCLWGLCVTCYPPRARRARLLCPAHTIHE
jgi:hypothetical protein